MWWKQCEPSNWVRPRALSHVASVFNEVRDQAWGSYDELMEAHHAVEEVTQA